MGTPELLEGQDARKRLVQLLKANGLARLAVAYWGKGAAHELGLHKRASETRILCDLLSGACNPDELKALLGLENVQIRKLDKLHAKLYCTPGGVLIGSSNAFANGLGQEGAELSGTVELNTFISAEAFAAKAEAWFDRRWEAAQPIDDAMIESVRHVYERNRAHREQNPTLNADLPPDMPERELAERILMRFLEKAKEIQAGAWRTDITPATAAQLMDTDPKWRADYTQFVGDP